MKSRTFGELSALATDLLGQFRFIGWILSLLGWNFNNRLNSFKHLKYPELILQTGNSKVGIMHDGLVSPSCSLGIYLINKTVPDKRLFLISAKHNEELQEVTEVSEIVENFLKSQQLPGPIIHSKVHGKSELFLLAIIIIVIFFSIFLPQEYYQTGFNPT